MALRKLVRHRWEMPVYVCSCNYAIVGTKLIFQPSEDTWTGTSLFHTTLALGFIMKAEVWRWIEVRFWFEWVLWVKVHKIMGNKSCSHKDIEITNMCLRLSLCVCVEEEQRTGGRWALTDAATGHVTPVALHLSACCLPHSSAYRLLPLFFHLSFIA